MENLWSGSQRKKVVVVGVGYCDQVPIVLAILKGSHTRLRNPSES